MGRALSIVFGLAAWVCSGFALLVGLFFGLAMKCGDSCSAGGVGGWRHDEDAWQWEGLAALGGFVFLCGAVLFFFVLLRRPVLAALAVVAGGIGAVVMAEALSSKWIEHLDRQGGGEILLLLTAAFAPPLAVLLTVPERRSRRSRG